MISEGSLQDFSLSDLLQIVSLNAASGRLVLMSEGREGVLECTLGQITGAVAPGLTSAEAVYAIFPWEAGTFVFQEDATLPRLDNVTVPMGELTQEGIRRLDSWRAIRREMPTLTLRARFSSHQAELPEGLSKAAIEVWAAISSGQGATIPEISASAAMGELLVAEALLALYQQGMLTIETPPEEAMRSMFIRASEEAYSCFASISGLKMTEGLERLLNDKARSMNVEVRWRNGRVLDGIPGSTPVSALRPVFKDFLSQQLEYVTRIHGAAFAEKALSPALATFSPEERASWQSLELSFVPAAPLT